MKKVLPLILGVFLYFQGSAQLFPPVYTNNTSSDSACDGSAFLMDSFLYSNPIWYGPNTILQTGGNAIYNLCTGTYTISVSDSSGSTSTFTFVVSSNAVDTCNGLIAYVQSQTNASSSNICDGSATILVSGGVAPYVYAGTGLVYPNGSIANLCPGSYAITVTDANGCVSTAPVYIYNNADTLNNNPGMGPGVVVNPFDVSATGLCDGGFSLTVLDSTWMGGVVQVFDYDGNQVASGVGQYVFSDSLCAGFYTLNFTEPNGNVTYTYTFLVGDNSNVYVDSTSYFNNGNPNGADSIYAPVAPVCTVTYSQIDSANVGGVNYIGTDSVAVDWMVYTNGVGTSVISLYQYDAAGNYVLVLQMYCDSTRAIETFKAYAWVNLDPNGPISVSTIEANGLLVYPNPASTVLTIHAGNQIVKTVRIFDILGNTVLETIPSSVVNALDIQLESLTNGVYFLECTTNQGVSTKKLVKE